MNEIVQWLIRNKNGEVDGPFTTVEVIRKIRSGIYGGDEYLSRYPSGRWYPISYDQNFFNILLEVLEQDLFEKSATSEGEKEDVTQRIENLKKEHEESKTHEMIFGHAVQEDLDAKTPVVIDMEPEAPVGRAVEDKKENQPKKKLKKARPKKKKYVSRRKKRGNLQMVLFTTVAAGLILYFFVFNPQFDMADRIHLRQPHYNKKKTAQKAEISNGMMRGIRAFRKDTFKDYLVAQDALVETVENSDSLDAYGFLCMTYRELWDYAYQDADDYHTVQVVLRKAQKINPKSASANVCLVVSYWIKGDYDNALRIMDNHLAQNPGLLFFNQMTGDIYAARKDYGTAVYYFSKVRELWQPPPVWSKAILQEARMYRKRGVHGTAVKLYRKLLSENPNHAVARIELGIIELTPYQNISKAKDYIRTGLAANQGIPKLIEAEAYVALAKIAVLQGNNAQGLQFGKKAFSLDSSNQEARELIVSLGGIKALNSVAIDNVNMVDLGEQYMKMNNYGGAQAEFRAAFEANDKNAFAALRAGEALWKLNQSNEAISWIKKSIHADPQQVRGYIILADYQSARFDYINAIETLKGALRVNPKHHGIFRGFALIELRRRNYPGAVRFAKKALELYDTDIESLLIMANALHKQGESEEGFKYIKQAMELDSSNEEVHISFAHIRAALQGTDAGINYLDAMIGKSGKVAYIRALGDLLASEERNQEAIQYYFDALAKDPKDKQTLMSLAKILQMQKDYERAREYFLEAATLDPSDAEPLYLIGQLYLDSGKNDFAIKQFDRVIHVNPNFPMVHYFAGQAHLAMNDNDKALEMALKERNLNPEIPDSYTLAGEAYYKKGQYFQCTEEYQKALSKGLNDSNVYVKLARCYRLSGSFDSAMTMLTEAEKRESGNPDIYKESGALYHMQGQLIKAAEFYKRYLQLSPDAKDKDFIQKQLSDLAGKGVVNEPTPE